ncbi:unnamed protein product [Rhodiola kirilowii]
MADNTLKTAVGDDSKKAPEVVPVLPRITDHKLVASNYLDWRNTIELYLLSVSMDPHMTENPPSDAASKVPWLRDDARLVLQIRNSIDASVIRLVSHCRTVKALLAYVEFLYSGKGNISRMYTVCQAFYRPEKGDQSLTDYFTEFKKIYEELNELLPFSPDIAVQHAQREKMALMSFLAGLPSEFETAKSQILSDSKVASLEDAFRRVLHTEPRPSPPLSSSAFIGRRPQPSGSFSYKGSSGSSENRPDWIASAECRYCHQIGHLKNSCPKKKRAPSANVVFSSPVTLSAAEYAHLRGLADRSSAPTAAIAQSGTSNTCLVSTSPQWVIDSGATDHMTGNPALFASFTPHHSSPPVSLADGTQSPVVGSVNPTSSLSLTSVLSLPKLSFNLMSVSRLTRSLNCCATFFPDHCVFQDLSTKKIIGKGRESAGLYILDSQLPKSVACTSSAAPIDAHCRLGHPSLSVLRKLCPQFLSLSSLDCDSCRFAKHHRLSSSPRVNHRASTPFELVHSDVWGPCPVPSVPGFRYFVTFVDDFSRMTWIYFMKNRSELLQHFSSVCAEIRTQFGVPVKTLRSDNAKEYLSAPFHEFMQKHGIIHQTSCVDTPSQNGVAERKNRHLLETARALLFEMQVPKKFWVDAVSIACFLINRMSSTVLSGESPFCSLFPSSSLFLIAPKIFGCTCFVRDVRPHLTKLDPKSLKCIFLGYSRVQKGYRCYSPDLQRYVVSADVVFSERTPFSSPAPRQGEPDDDFLLYMFPTHTTPPAHVPPLVRPPIIHTYFRRPRPEVTVISDVQPTTSDAPISSSSDPPLSDDLPIALRKGTRTCTYPISSFVSYDRLSESSRSFIASLASVPNSVSEALAHSGWRDAMVEEMNALDANGTWVLTDLPPGARSIGCKWVFTVKVNPDGSVARLKARLVAKGYSQTYGIDYFDTFSPVAKLTSIRLLISLAASHHWPLHQLDIKNAFLHGDLQEPIYMEQPPGFVAQGESAKVCYLHKSLYGLKQSPRAWFSTFTAAVEKYGMQKSKSDHSVFYTQSGNGIILLVVYVDDIVITGNNSEGIDSLKGFLQTQFNTKDLGRLRYFLGVEVSRSKKGIFLSQRKYVLDLLSETGKIGAKPCSTPMIPNLQLTKSGELFDDPERYRRLVGKLNYLRMTRPDIAYPVSVVSQYMSSPTVDHWKAVEQILGYLKGSPGRGIVYGSHGHENIECFSDADWAGSKEDRRSTSGYGIMFGGNLISWQSKKQKVVSRSSAESEYRAMSTSTCEIVWIHQFLTEIGLKVSVPAKLWCDNQAALHISSNPVFHERTKHIEIDCHFVREKVQLGLITTGYMKTEDQLGDLFTKALNGTRIDYLCGKLGMIDIYAPA